MITVRFPSGFSVQYNDASWVNRFTYYSDLYTKKDGAWVAQVPNEALIEGIQPCRTYNGAVDETKNFMRQEIEGLRREICSLKRSLGKLVKK